MSSNGEDSEGDLDNWTEPVVSDFVSVLEDFLDEEVVDQQGTAIGTLACYWPSVSGSRVLLGIKLNGQENLRVIPGRRSQLDDRRTCIRIGFDVVDIVAAPSLDCARELDATTERNVFEFFGVAATEPPQACRHSALQAPEIGRAGAQAAASANVSPAPEAFPIFCPHEPNLEPNPTP